jgi:hypothetical protein
MKGKAMKATQTNVQELFAQFMTRVDHYLVKYVGLTHLDMEDYSYWSSFAAGNSALKTARDAIAYNCEGMLLDVEDILTESIGDAAKYRFDSRLDIR